MRVLLIIIWILAPIAGLGASFAICVGINYRREVRENEALRKRIGEIEKLLLTDALTGLLNKRGLDTFIAGYWERHAYEKSAMAIIAADVNDFKRINDTLGHLAGDQYLRDIAKAIKEALRGTDLLARPGGDEYIVILPSISRDKANQIVQRMKESVETKTGETISAGVAFGIPEEDFNSIDEMIAAADQEMYRDKENSKK